MFERHREREQAESRALLHDALTSMLAIVDGKGAPQTPVMLQRGERATYVIEGAGLFETRHDTGHWEGRSAGVSVPVTGSVRVRVGQSRGHYVQGAEAPTIIDTGTITFTTARVVFLGGRYTREWDFAKVLGIQHFTDQPWTAIQVSGRQKTSGFTYPGLQPALVHARLDLAVDLHEGHADQARAALVQQLAELDAALAPAAPATTPQPLPATAPVAQAPAAQAPVAGGTPPPPPQAPACWAPDPWRQHRWRWWDGASWTSYTSD